MCSGSTVKYYVNLRKTNEKKEECSQEVRVRVILFIAYFITSKVCFNVRCIRQQETCTKDYKNMQELQEKIHQTKDIYESQTTNTDIHRHTHSK